jgi:hypothetical protein
VPGVQPDVMMVAPGRDECSLVAVHRDQLKPEQIAIELQGPRDVGHFQVNVTDACLGWDDVVAFHGAKLTENTGHKVHEESPPLLNSTFGRAQRAQRKGSVTSCPLCLPCALRDLYFIFLYYNLSLRIT